MKLFKKTTPLKKLYWLIYFGCLLPYLGISQINFLDDSKVYALSIGVSTYKNFDDLKYADKDAMDFAKKLKSVYPNSEIEVLTNEKASRNTIYPTITGFLHQATKDDLLIFFFSGHGGAESQNPFSNLLLTSTNSTNYYITAIDLSTLSNLFQSKPIEERPRVLVIVDACRTGEGILLKKTYNDIESLFKNYSSILMACQAGEQSLEDATLQQGIFTYYLLKAVEECPEDNSKLTNYELVLRELEHYLNFSIRSHTKDKQIPQVVGDMNEIIFPCVLSQSTTAKQPPSKLLRFIKTDSLPTDFFKRFEEALDNNQQEDAKSIFEKVPDTPEYKALKAVMKEKLISHLFENATGYLKTYLHNGLDTLSLITCNMVVEDLSTCASLIDISYFRYPQVMSRLYFFSGLQKKLEGDVVGAKDFFIKGSEVYPRATYNYVELFYLLSLSDINYSWSIFPSLMYKIEELSPKWINWKQFHSKLDTLDLVTRYNKLAMLKESEGKLADAEDLFSKAIANIDNIDSKSDLLYSYSSNKLGEFYYKLGNYNTALKLFKNNINLLSYEVHDFDYAFSYNQTLSNIAYAYTSLGDYDSALPYFKKFLDDANMEHPRYEHNLKTLAQLYYIEGNYSEAIKLTSHSLEIIDLRLGKQSSQYGRGLNNLAVLYYFEGLDTTALRFSLVSLNNIGESIGKDQLEYGICLNNLALIRLELALKSDTFAIGLFQEAIEIIENKWGKNHPIYKKILTNLGIAYTNLRDYDEALPLYKEVLQLTEATLGKQHEEYAYALNNLASCYAELKKSKLAINLYKEVLRLTKTDLDSNLYPEALNNLALVYTSIVENETAFFYYQLLEEKGYTTEPNFTFHPFGPIML